MSGNRAERVGNPRDSRLRNLFYKVLSGEQTLAGSQTPKLFIEAICTQPDPVQCIERLISSPKGLFALQSALRSDISLNFLNTSAAAFVKYLQEPDLELTCQGEFLRDVITVIVEPPIFWDALLKAQRLKQLESDAEQCFSWLLLQLISLPSGRGSRYQGIARDPRVQDGLLESSQLQVRVAGQKIKHILETIKNPDEFQGDGPGGRHDNDFVNIREIAIMPTPDEIASKEFPYLRRASEIDGSSEVGRLAMHIDNQFRLLREDMLRDLREELQVVLGIKKGRRKALSVSDLAIEGLDCNERQPWAVRLKCDKDLPQLYGLKAGARKKYVTEHRNLFKHQSLATLMTDDEIIALVTINRDEDLLAHDPPIICVRFSGRGECVAKALLALKMANRVRLIQLNTAMFAYEPVLRQLQATKTLMLQDEIMLWDTSKSLKATPLSFYTSVVDLIARTKHDPSYDLQALLSLPNSTKLDNSQVNCLVAGLTQRLSVVQGPPGTGKSFLGALIAKAIYKFSTEKILVVCYTNHALDAFIEDLLKVGIPGNSIVRLGSIARSSATTQSLVLSNQKTNSNPLKDYWNVINKRKADLADESAELRSSFGEYEAKAVSKSELMQYLEFDLEAPDFYEAFVLPEESHDMTRVGKKGKAINQFYLLDCWARGEDAGIYQDVVGSKYPAVWSMIHSARATMLQKWKRNILKDRVSKVYDAGIRYNETITQIKALFSEKDRCIINEKRIIGCTTTAAAKYVQMLQSVAPGVLMVEEAGEILESHILTALGRETAHVVLIGDHKQLRPKTHHDLSVEKGDGYDLNRSLFERLIIKGYPHQILSQQHRMRPEISSLVRNLTYPDLIDAPGTKTRPKLIGFQDNLVFLNHEIPEDEVHDVTELRDGSSTSKRNNFEARMTLNCVRYLGQQGYGTGQIVILTPYVAQLRLLFDVLAKENDPVLNDLDSYDLVQAGLMPAATAKMQKRELRISTIDNYQGEESDIVVISLTRCNDRGDIGFLSSPERLNVLLSRARDALIIIGNAKTFLHSHRGKELWSKFLRLLKDGSHVYDGLPVQCARHPERKLLLCTTQDFENCPDGGCSEPCNALLNCGVHNCPRQCHQLFDHSKVSCKFVIRSKCLTGHAQSWKCHMGKLATCRECERERRAKEKKAQEEYDRHQRIEQEQQEYASAIAKLDDEIRILREVAANFQRSKDMVQSLEQKKRDLEDAKFRATRLSSSNTEKLSTTNTIHPGSTTDFNKTGDTFMPLSIQSTVIPESEAEANEEKDPVSSASEVEWARQKLMDNASSDALDSLMKMTGLEEVKAQVLKIKAKVETALRQNTNIADERFGVVLLGNPGTGRRTLHTMSCWLGLANQLHNTGKTTVARLYAKFLSSMGVLAGEEFVETSGSRLANDGVAGAKKHIDDIIKAGGGCFFLDEAYQLSSGNSYGGAAVLDFLLAEIENQLGKIVFIFAGYNKQMEKFFEHNEGFSSRMPYRLQFTDYSDKELLQMLGQRIKKKYHGNMSVEGGMTGLYARIAVRRLGRGRGREGFGNARALENILARISERQAHRLQRERVAGILPNDFFFKQEDLVGPEPSKAIVECAAWKDLQSLTGLNSVKKSMQGLLDRIHTNYQRELEEKEIVETSLNRVFLGSPGTGKTSVAKLYGQILSDIGLLSNGEVVVKNPADFVGGVLGESEKNTKTILKTTEGKTLVIDEAYMLYSGNSGSKSSSDPYKTAVIDTIVAEIQSTLGEDRCVLLLGYKEQMEDMFRNTNHGLARRFALDDAFQFDDFDDDQLRQILDMKLNKQNLCALNEAKDVAISVLARARQRPNFGNAGEVENMISRAKSSYQARESTKPLSARSVNIVFEPQDFDVNFDRSAHAITNCKELFKDVLGCDDIVSKLEGFMQTSANLRARDIDPREHIPFNFVFKGPPGTGKTTTARKMGQVFYDMGFLSTPAVHECSATDLIAGYVGQTGLKTIEVLEKALGRVLFVDEAYRLGEGMFAKEAINELVDSLTKHRYAGKIVVILAGYEDNMNQLLSVNPGLSSRFSEEVMFTNMTPEDCWRFLRRSLEKTNIMVDAEVNHGKLSKIVFLFEELSNLPAWGNGRDVQTISKSVTGLVYRSASTSKTELTVSYSQIIKDLEKFLAERRARSAVSNPRMKQPRHGTEIAQDLVQHPRVVSTKHSATMAKDEPEIPEVTIEESVTVSSTLGLRDVGVTDATWAQLQADRAAEELAYRQLEDALADAEEATRLAAAEEAARVIEAERLATQKVRDEEMENQKRCHEEARLRRLAAQQAKDAADAKLRKIQELAELKRKEEAKVQAKLRDIGEVTPSDALSDTLSLLLSFPLNQVMGFISILSSDVPSFAAILTATFVSSGLTAYFALKSSNSSPILSVLVVITALTSAFITACLAFLYTRHRFVAACARERAYGRQEQRDRYRYDRDVWEVDRMEIGLVEVGAAPLLESETPSKEETELKNVREAEQEQVLEADLWVVGEDQEEDEEEDAGFEWEEVL